MIDRLLIANRGEIAVRIAQGARELGIVPLGIYSEADRRALHVLAMSDAVCVGPPQARDSYLNTGAIVAAAKTLRADAVHPGYGFLSERADFAQAVLDAGLIFVGPPPAAMAAMGSKRDAKMLARTHDVPVVPGYEGAEQSTARLRAEAERIAPPLLIKASAGGGGRGMRVVTDLALFDEALEAAKREAKAAFGDETMLLERYLHAPRHIEFQILADAYGNIIHLGERECSIQRRHQKIVEEAPSVALTPELRAQMGAAAVRAARSVNYVNAGTVEFLLAADGTFYFLEMNTRLQVEHPITELVHDIDLVHWQLRIAGGERLVISQAQVAPRGWAIEARIYSEDPFNNMLPSTGTIAAWSAPSGPGIRLDSGVAQGSDVSMYYDPMLAKLISWGADRDTAVRRMQVALDSFLVAGVRTNLPLLSWIVRSDEFQRGATTTRFLEDHLPPKLFAHPPAPTHETLALAAAAALQNGAAGWRLSGIGIPLRLCDAERTYAFEAAAMPDEGRWKISGDLKGELAARDGGSRLRVELNGTRIHGTAAINSGDIDVAHGGTMHRFRFAAPPSLQLAAHAGTGAAGHIVAPMPGRIVKVAVRAGDSVGEHALLMILEAMKMEHRIEAPSEGTVKAIFVKDGELVSGSAPLLELE